SPMSFLLVLLLAACGGDTTVDPSPQADAPRARAKAKARRGKGWRPAGRPTTLAGALVFQDDAISLRPCAGGDEPVVLRDGQGRASRVREELGAQGDQLYVQLRGLRQQDGSVVVKAIDAAVAGG